MLLGYKLISFSHKDVDLSRLSDFILPFEDEAGLYHYIKNIQKENEIEELLYLHTCNRILVLIYTNNQIFDFEKFSRNLFFHLTEKDKLFFLANARMLENLEAVEHIMRIASSMESLVVGEREILRQIRIAYNICHEHEMTGDAIRLLLQSIVRTAKEVHTKTCIGVRAVSVASLAFKKLREFGLTNENHRIAMIGAGETQHLMSKFLKKYFNGEVDVYNRTLLKAKALANSLNGQGYALADLKKNNNQYKIWIACTSSTEPTLTEEIFNEHAKSNERYCIVDLGIPRDVAEFAQEHPDIRYIDIPSLKDEAIKNLKYRTASFSDASIIIRNNLKKFYKEFQQRQIELAFCSLPQKMQVIKDRAINEIFKDEIDRLDPEAKELVNSIAEYLTKKSINIPYKTAKEII